MHQSIEQSIKKYKHRAVKKYYSTSSCFEELLANFS